MRNNSLITNKKIELSFHKILTIMIVGSVLSLSALGEAKSAPLQHTDGLETTVQNVYKKGLLVKGGKNADYIPALAEVNSKLLGVSVVTVDGKVVNVGDTQSPFTIQSISKVFTLATAMKERSAGEVLNKVGVNATGLPFNSSLAVALNKDGKAGVNPLVNAGALATTSLVKGKSSEEKYQNILNTLSNFAGKALTLNDVVYQSEADTNQHNQALAKLLEAYNRLYDNPEVSTDAYTKACSVNVTSHDLAMMGSVLANGGVHPVTGKKLLSKEEVGHILAVMSTNGFYETSGEWLFWTGLPGKSGVGGGILAVVPGKMAIAVFSPPLDAAGNSVKGQYIVKELSEQLKLNIFVSEPVN